jgi:hypothetical protein
MTEFSIDHELPGSAEHVWALVVSDDFNAELYARVQVDRELVSEREEAGVVHRVVRSTSRRQLPGFVKKLLGGELGFTERIEWRRGETRLSLAVEPTIMAKRTRFASTLAVEPLGEGRSRRVFAGAIAVDLPIVGRRVEQGAIRDMRRIHDLAAQMMRERLV